MLCSQQFVDSQIITVIIITIKYFPNYVIMRYVHVYTCMYACMHVGMYVFMYVCM